MIWASIRGSCCVHFAVADASRGNELIISQFEGMVAMKITALFAFSTAALVLAGCSPDVPFEEPRLYGEALAEMNRVSLSEIMAQAAEYDGQTVFIEGVTRGVCQSKGCWMYIADGGKEIRVNFKDYAFFVPVGSEGKRVKAQGIITTQHVSKETRQHWEEDGGGDPSSIHSDSTIVMLTASSVVIERGEELSEKQQQLMSQQE